MSRNPTRSPGDYHKNISSNFTHSSRFCLCIAESEFLKFHILQRISLTEKFPVAKKGRGQRAVGVNYLTHILLLVHRKTPASKARSPARSLSPPRSGAAGRSPHRLETEWLTHPVLNPAALGQMRTSKADSNSQHQAL